MRPTCTAASELSYLGTFGLVRVTTPQNESQLRDPQGRPFPNRATLFRVPNTIDARTASVGRCEKEPVRSQAGDRLITKLARRVSVECYSGSLSAAEARCVTSFSPSLSRCAWRSSAQLG